jgi:outer membrane lipoprotein carrier protein
MGSCEKEFGSQAFTAQQACARGICDRRSGAVNTFSSPLKICLVVLALTLSLQGSQGPADIHAIAQAVDQRYNRLHTLSAGFTEIYRGGGMDRTETGVLSLKKPGKMRWEYRSPKEKLFLSDGKDAWFYLPGDRQARKSPAKKLDDLRSPLALLLGKTQLEKELQGLSFASDVTPLTPGDVVLRGVPRSMADRISQVLLEVRPDGAISRITIEELDGSTTEYRFTDQKENVALTDASFRFTPPAGVEVIDGDLGQ